MPPQVKPIISKIDDLICSNCVCFALVDDNYVCYNPNSLDWHRYPEDFCTEGKWRIAVSQGRPSTVEFPLAYDYLIGD